VNLDASRSNWHAHATTTAATAAATSHLATADCSTCSSATRPRLVSSVPTTLTVPTTCRAWASTSSSPTWSTPPWGPFTSYRFDLARLGRDWATAHRLQTRAVAWHRDRAAAALDTPPDRLTDPDPDRKRVRDLAVSLYGLGQSCPWRTRSTRPCRAGSPRQWTAFVEGVKLGEFDLTYRRGAHP
jgi:hypothetical protein